MIEEPVTECGDRLDAMHNYVYVLRFYKQERNHTYDGLLLKILLIIHDILK